MQRKLFLNKRKIKIEGGGIHGSKKEGQEGNYKKEEDHEAKEEVVSVSHFSYEQRPELLGRCYFF